ncbi:MAG: TIGR03936 family radical SAM-associated protein, partial [Oscillospiraceae bacterium]
TFNTPLPLGIESVCESLDARLLEDINFEDVITRLNKNLPNGLKVVKIDLPIKKQNDIKSAIYKIYNIPIEYKNKLEQFLSNDEIIESKKTKKGFKDLNLKEYIISYKINDNIDISLVDLKINLLCGNTQNLNPLLLLNKFCTENKIEDNFSYLRESILVDNQEEFK